MIKRKLKKTLLKIIRGFQTGYIWRYIFLRVPPLSWISGVVLRIKYSESYWLNISNRAGRNLFLNLDWKLNKVQNKVIRDLKGEGISVIKFEDLFSKKEFEKLRCIAENHLRRPEIKKEIKSGKIRRKGASKKFQVRPLGEKPEFELNDDFMALAINDKLLKIVSGYLGVMPRLKNIQLWYNKISKGNWKYSQNWHRDPEDKRFVKVFLYFRDVDSGAGPFSYVIGTNQEGKLFEEFPVKPFQGSYPPAESVDKFKKNILVGTGKKGALIFCDTRGIHRGGYCTKRERYLLTFVYTSNAASSKPKFSVSKNINKLDQLSEIGKYVLEL